MGLEPNAWIWSSRISFSPVLNVTFCFEFASFSGGSFPSGDKSPEIGSGFTLSLQRGWVYLIIVHISRWSTKSTRNKNPSQSVLFGQRRKFCEWFNLDVLLLLSGSAISGSLWPLGQHARLPCLSLSPRVCLNSCQLNQWCHSTISSSAIPFASCLQSFPPSIRIFSNESALCIRWPKYWSFSFSISPSNEYSGLISIQNSKLGTLAVSLLAISQY